jgi:hypothetical protein
MAGSAKQSSFGAASGKLNCFVAELLAMTSRRDGRRWDRDGASAGLLTPPITNLTSNFGYSGFAGAGKRVYRCGKKTPGGVPE